MVVSVWIPKPKTIGIQELWGNKPGQPQDWSLLSSAVEKPITANL
jgi:hypothetical protein